MLDQADVTAGLNGDFQTAVLQTLDRSLATASFAPDGTIRRANRNFLSLFGYEAGELIGRNRTVLADPGDISDVEYAAFWSELRSRAFTTAECRRRRKDGSPVWLRASYTPVTSSAGEVVEIVMFATDMTEEKMRAADYEGQIAAIHQSQAVITFDMHGTVMSANDRFLDATGYRLDEIEGRHHRMFVDPSYSHGQEYATFWNNLSEGRHQAGEYKRFGKDGREVWLQATYNPVRDLSGRPFKVVKYATVVTREKLRQADHQGQIASIHKAQCVISFDLDGHILDANDNFLAATGYRLAEVRGRRHAMFVDAETAESADYAAFWNELARGRHQAAEYKRICKDGREIWLQASYNPIFDMNGRVFKVVKYATDVTDEKLRQADIDGQITAIRKSQCMIALDMNGGILDANENFLTAMGYELGEIVGRSHRMFVEESVATSEEYAAFWATLRAGSFLSAKFKRIGKGGRAVWIQASYNPILDLNGRPFKVIKIATDVTAEMALAESFHSARQQAQHDAATGLPNRVGLAGFLSAALGAPGARLSMFYLDLDHFKPINDTFGHHVGDHVLRETANRLRRALHPDHIVARIGGDEFVVAAPDLDASQIDPLCRRLIEVVKAPIRYEGRMLTVGLSIGVAVSPADATTPDDLLRCADVALYRSKGSGRGVYSVFADEMNERLVADRHLADEMRHGIKAGQFFLEYQPRFDARTRTIRCVEALVRWAHPARGRLEPLDFLALAENSGLILPLGEWVLRTACHAVLAWPGVAVSVNVSPVQFRGANLADVVAHALAETGLDAGRLELEIPEGVLIEDIGRAHAGLDALKAKGVRLSLVDVGAGSASRKHIASFPFDMIKIDRRVVADMEASDDSRETIDGLLSLGRRLGIEVTAEGVETPGQLLMLSFDECSQVQGFLLAEPMAAGALAARLAEEEPAATSQDARPWQKAERMSEHLRAKSTPPQTTPAAAARPRLRRAKDGSAAGKA